MLGTGAYLPARVVRNEEIAARCGVSPEWIVERTGFVERRRAADHEATSDLGAEAAERAMQRAGVAASDVDLVICATCSPDHQFPSTAALIAKRLGARGAGAFDLQAGCAGFVYGTVLAAQSVASSMARRVLVIGADVVSRLVDPTDPATAPIFGDGAGAAIFGPAHGGSDEGIEAAWLGADGEGAHLLSLPAGGSRTPASPETLGTGAHALHMLGPALFRRAVRHTADAARRVLAAAALSPADIDLVVPHQSSRRLIEATARECGFEPERVVVNLERYGNTSCASLPIALDEAVRGGRLPAGSHALLLGFGAGLSWGAAILRT
jgi:3-oxoacyl-[acyl-carrier-protein] synthase-3